MAALRTVWVATEQATREVTYVVSQLKGLFVIIISTSWILESSPVGEICVKMIHLSEWAEGTSVSKGAERASQPARHAASLSLGCGYITCVSLSHSECF